MKTIQSLQWWIRGWDLVLKKDDENSMETVYNELGNKIASLYLETATEKNCFNI